MEPTRDTLEELKLIPWGQRAGLALQWRSGLSEAFPIWGKVEPLREKITIAAEDGKQLLRTLQENEAWAGDWRYEIKPGQRHMVGLPSVVFQWFREDTSSRHPIHTSERAPCPVRGRGFFC